MTSLMNVFAASATARGARVLALEAAAGAHVGIINEAIDVSAQNGNNHCDIELPNVRTAAQVALINLLRMHGYEVANTSSINPQAPFSLNIRWAE